MLIDGDPQGLMTISLGYREPDSLEYTLSTLLSEVMEEKKLSLTHTIIQHDEGVDWSAGEDSYFCIADSVNGFVELF